MVTCTVREVRRAGGRLVSPDAHASQDAVAPPETVAPPSDETGLAGRRGDRAPAGARPSGRS